MKGSSNKIHLFAFLSCVFLVGSVAGAGGFSPAARASTFIFSRNLFVGISGSDVSALQRFLITGSFLKISTSTGYFGPLTKAALGAWQTSEGINPPVGFFGPISRTKINLIIQPAPTNTSTTPGVVETATPNVATTSAAISNSPDGSPALPTGRPVRLKIPKLNIDAGFQYMGLKSDGTMEIPNNVIDVGWFTGSPRPGEKGNAIITGHVAQIRGGVLTKPGVFINLNELRSGDTLSVLNDKGETVTFVVQESRLYDPAADATDVFTSTDGGAHLNLITCEGTWNPAQLSYSQRLVVFADASR